MKLAYFVHDLSDATVERRTRMLAAGGASVTVIGFRRGLTPASTIAGAPAFEIGRTSDAMLASRTLTVAGALARLETVAPLVRGADVIVARNLEMLVIAARARRRYAPDAALIYESLDIHRLLLANRFDGALLRSLESRLWREVDLLLTSSPAFVRHYFGPRGYAGPVRLVENKVLLLPEAAARPTPRPPAGPPWRIGWFGMIRCRRSLDMLAALTQVAGGAVEVIIRGRPTAAVFPDFAAQVADLPHVHYGGPYRNPEDLARIYGEVHFAWAIDFYEEGQNSAWLLPNRIYEGTLYGAVPIALAGVETGAWLASHGIGMLLDAPPERNLIDFFGRLGLRAYTGLAEAVAGVPLADLADGAANCKELVRSLVPSREAA